MTQHSHTSAKSRLIRVPKKYVRPGFYGAQLKQLPARLWQLAQQTQNAIEQHSAWIAAAHYDQQMARSLSAVGGRLSLPHRGLKSLSERINNHLERVLSHPHIAERQTVQVIALTLACLVAFGGVAGHQQKTYANEASLSPTQTAELASPTLGPDQAPVEIVSFQCFQCPFSAQLWGNLEQLHKQFPDQVKVVYKNYPLPTHEHAVEAANYALASHILGKFEPAAQILFAAQDDLLTVLDPVVFADRLGVELASFEAALHSPAVQSRLTADVQLAEQLDINSTPISFINGQKIEGTMELDHLRRVVMLELARAGDISSLQYGSFIRNNPLELWNQ